MIRVALAGARGKTGSALLRALQQADDIDVVGYLMKSDARAEKQEYTNLDELAARCSPQVLVDFTVFPDSKTLALQAISLGVRPVIGTSGYQASDVKELQTACRERSLGGVFAANFALGAVLMMQFAQNAGRYFRWVEIVETHDANKKDAPSGTALATAARIASTGTFQHPAAGAVKADGARGAEISGVGVHSLRLPGVISDQEIIFANDDERLVIRHSTSSRRAFVSGVLMAVRASPKLDHLVVGLEELLT